MYHPLYYKAEKCIGDTVYVYHVAGHIYQGTLLSAETDGVYVLLNRPSVVPPEESMTSRMQHEDSYIAQDQYNLLFSPAVFFSFKAITFLSSHPPTNVGEGEEEGTS